MTVNPRRPAFRLPWTDDGASEPATAEVSASAPSDAADATDGEATPAAEAPQPTDATTSEVEEAPVSDEFLQNLVGAMRTVAEESRDGALADLRQNVETRIEQLRAAAAERAEELRRGSEFDIVATGDWEKSEIERAKAEAERRVAGHRAELDRQLAEHRSASEREIEATRRRLADYEAELKAFFTQLSEIHDPAEFVAAAKRMPRGPELPATVPAVRSSADVTEPVGEADTDTDTDTDTEAAAPEAAAPEAAAPDAAPSDQTSAEGVGEPPAEQNGKPEATAPEATNEAEPKVSAEPVDARLAKRLAELDRRLSNGESSKPAPGTETEPEPKAETESPSAATAESTESADKPESESTAAPESAPGESGESNGEVSTPIMVKGLGSFGAITSFKQALERADGIQGVTLSLGPGGEFVYRANHAPGFDLVAAIRGIEGQAVTIDEADGSLMVTIQRGR
jgi:hypothetical protein